MLKILSPASPKPGSWAAKVASSPAKKDATTSNTTDNAKVAVPAAPEGNEKILPPVPVATGEKKAQAPPVSGDKKVSSVASSSSAAAVKGGGAKTKREFTGACFKCGEKGHRANECKKNEGVVKAA